MHKTKNTESLKPGWRRVRFGDVVQLSKARCADPLTEGVERYVGLEHLEPGDLRIRNWGNVADGVTFTSVFRPGQVLFGKRRAYQRKVAVADFPGVCSGDIYVMETKDAQGLMPELLPFICQTDAFFNHAVGTSAGSLSPRTNWTSLEKFEFELPPAKEQPELLAVILALQEVIDSQFALIASARELQKSALRDMILKLDKCRTLPITELGLPTADVLRTGPFGSNLKASYFIASGVPVLSIGSLGEDGIIASELFHLSPEIASGFAEYRVVAGDVVFSRVADVGRCHLVTTDEEQFIISSNLIRIRVDAEKVLPTFLILLLKHSQNVRDQIARLTTQAAGRLLVNTKTLSKLNFPVPSFADQAEVVQVSDKLRFGIDQARARYVSSRRELGRILDILIVGGKCV